jgi:hypothetical protein
MALWWVAYAGQSYLGILDRSKESYSRSGEARKNGDNVRIDILNSEML